MTSVVPESDSDNPWVVHDRTVVYDNPWIEVVHHEVTDPSGAPGIYGVVQYRNRAVGVVPIDEDDHTYLVGQYRFATGSYSWEIPEGGCPAGEDPADAARRELAEETGLLAGRIEALCPPSHLSNCVTNELAFSFLATELTRGDATPDSTEKLVVRRLPTDDAISMAVSGEITDALSVLSLLHLARRRSS